ncbi:hypothetical protein HO173_005339 [Letharia columbiana]|uniref:Uncharacterized protein n=1 Tax=Letharia columbiana TaxID=112416 RepID=A0A8H6FXF6_9LECA|nr:uncharacterized protein HO173_005339 [Letharia columbiana]KAF6236558.1 hypothetical protein HO173_005339 [Letharia columbiana]
MGSLKSVYQSFLASPNASALNNDASLNYITTLTTINTAAAIIKHHAAHQKVLTKKEEKVLSCIEGRDALCLDVETTLEFITGGGAYLPGLDDNFLADRVVTFPMVHIVHFDSTQKIQQVRLYWDQGSLLKLVDVIGSRARNWPIRDGKDQARLIASSAAVITQSNGPTRPATENGSCDADHAAVTTKPRSQSKNVTRDPHASLALFAPREEEEDSSAPAAVAPRASAKPPPRDYHDLFVGNESDASPISKEKIISPQKENMTLGPIAPKGGVGKNYQPSRLFETDNPQPGTPGTPIESSAKFIKPDPNKYNHFEFGDGNEKQMPMAARPKSKHQNNWDFADVMTPDKVPIKVRGQDVRHFGWSDDEPVMDSPVKHPAVAKARPDANTNFEFQDDDTPGGERGPDHHRGQANAKGFGMYQNNVFDESDLPHSPEKKGHPLANLEDRRKNFDPHFSMTDDAPSHSANVDKQPIPEARAKVIQQMGAQWEASGQSPVSRHPTSKIEDVINPTSGDKENFLNGGGNKHVGIKSGGDGMGGKKGAGRSWGFGDDSPGPQPASKNENRINPVSGDKENISNGGGKKHVGIKNGGDGMGGKKGAGRAWGFGDDSDEDGVGGRNGGKFQASKIQQAPKDSGFWDF